MEELKNIIREIQSYKNSLSLNNLSDDMILDCSVRIFNSQNIESNHNPKKESQTNQEILATAKQINLLKKLKYKGDISTITKKEASALIDEMMQSRK
jgi:hypothetical protein